MKDITNQKLAQVLYEMAALYAMRGIEFKPRAYEKAAMSVESFNEDLATKYKQEGPSAFKDIPGVGSAIAKHLQQLITGHHFKEYEQLKKNVPVKIDELLRIEGVGPQTIRILWEKLKIKTVDDLEAAVKAGKVHGLPGFGARSEQKISKGIEFVRQAGGRAVLGFVYDQIKQLEAKIQKLAEVDKAILAGSVRRMKETIGDLDFLATSAKPAKVMERFVKLPEVEYVYDQGETKTNVRLRMGLDADLRVVPARSWGAALNYFTGSKDHNVGLRRLAVKKHLKLSEYGLFKGQKFLAGKIEEELYRRFGMDYIEPELREMRGEMEAAIAHKLPALIGYDDLKGDLQVQTNWTDGKASIEGMAKAAQAAGLDYLAITDHTKSLAMTKGLDDKRLLKQIKAIERINARLKGIRVLKGSEVNIAKDGALDISNEVLSQLEVVGASIHSHFDLPPNAQTRRLIKAIESPNVDIIFHLTTRLLNRRKPIEFDFDEVLKAAKATGTVLEVNAYPDRLDIDDEQVKQAIESSIKLAIDSDAHAPMHFLYLKFGLAQARRGWATKNDVINSWPVDKMLKLLKGTAKKT